eukprot:scaffold137_cov398-Prasinococcus_capsulatus_cf.AAC.28
MERSQGTGTQSWGVESWYAVPWVVVASRVARAYCFACRFVGSQVGAGASVLGNIVVGDRCKIGTNSVVLKALPEGATAVGAPAKVIGRVQERKPSVELDHNLHNLKVANEVSESYFSLWDKSRLGTLDPEKRENCLCPDAFATRLVRGCAPDVSSRRRRTPS